ncbi:hypothetical protein AXG93_3016s1320 [Marchantia polymorpha subsp. ruderalis]|uniref:Uncharacterized protein n=1 Tax=Marchantia polymorpha subsp. ruderalis TaxID=1480154 RepID=A0A176WBR7_MARPO|nr:hypothetical protein AXG93_3016s1320 [Marchantia polymorpha subsp. ruderalis]
MRKFDVRGRVEDDKRGHGGWIRTQACRQKKQRDGILGLKDVVAQREGGKKNCCVRCDDEEDEGEVEEENENEGESIDKEERGCRAVEPGPCPAEESRAGPGQVHGRRRWRTFLAQRNGGSRWRGEEINPRRRGEEARTTRSVVDMLKKAAAVQLLVASYVVGCRKSKRSEYCGASSEGGREGRGGGDGMAQEGYRQREEEEGGEMRRVVVVGMVVL